MLSQVARQELAPDGIVVSIVYPSVTATEFHQSLAAGARVGGDSRAVRADTAESVAEAIVGVIESGEEEVMLASGWGGGGIEGTRLGSLAADGPSASRLRHPAKQVQDDDHQHSQGNHHPGAEPRPGRWPAWGRSSAAAVQVLTAGRSDARLAAKRIRRRLITQDVGSNLDRPEGLVDHGCMPPSCPPEAA